MSQTEVAAYVQSHLRNHKIYVTLSGGAAVSIYTVNRYVSADVDLVEDTYADRTQIETAMEEIGFREKNRYFVHSDTQHIVEFPSGPLSVGGEPVKHIEEIKCATGILRVISPTDCVSFQPTFGTLPFEERYEKNRRKISPLYPVNKKTGKIELPEEIIADLKFFLLAGNKPAADKRVCELTGVGLRASKDVVDALQQQRRLE